MLKDSVLYLTNFEHVRIFDNKYVQKEGTSCPNLDNGLKLIVNQLVERALPEKSFKTI